MTLSLQALGGFNYLILFGVVLAAEIGLCKFITTCTEDVKEQFNRLGEGNFKNAPTTKAILKDAIEIHQVMRQLGELQCFFLCFNASQPEMGKDNAYFVHPTES